MAARTKTESGKALSGNTWVPVDDRHVLFPGGTKVGDSVKNAEGEAVKFTAELAAKVTNPKAWADGEPEAPADDAPAPDGE